MHQSTLYCKAQRICRLKKQCKTESINKFKGSNVGIPHETWLKNNLWKRWVRMMLHFNIFRSYVCQRHWSKNAWLNFEYIALLATKTTLQTKYADFW